MFDVSEEELKASGAGQGDDLLLTLKGKPFAALKVEEVFKLPDRWEFADAVFGFWRGSCGLWFLPLAVTGFTAESCRGRLVLSVVGVAAFRLGVCRLGDICWRLLSRGRRSAKSSKVPKVFVCSVVGFGASSHYARRLWND